MTFVRTASCRVELLDMDQGTALNLWISKLDPLRLYMPRILSICGSFSSCHPKVNQIFDRKPCLLPFLSATSFKMDLCDNGLPTIALNFMIVDLDRF